MPIVQSLSRVLTQQPHGLQCTRLLCPPMSPRVCSNSCPLSCWHYLTNSIFPSIRAFSSESALPIRWSKYWSFSFSNNPSNEYSGLISFRIDWFDLLAAQGTLESSPAPQFESIRFSVLSLLYGPALYGPVSAHDYWKNQNFDQMDLYQQRDAFKYAL